MRSKDERARDLRGARGERSPWIPQSPGFARIFHEFMCTGASINAEGFYCENGKYQRCPAKYKIGGREPNIPNYSPAPAVLSGPRLCAHVIDLPTRVPEGPDIGGQRPLFQHLQPGRPLSAPSDPEPPREPQRSSCLCPWDVSRPQASGITSPPPGVSSHWPHQFLLPRAREQRFVTQSRPLRSPRTEPPSPTRAAVAPAQVEAFGLGL